MATDAVAPAGGLSTATLRARQQARVAQSLAAEERRGRELAMKGRAVALTAVGMLVLLLVPLPGALYYEALIATFILLGFARLELERSGLYRWWHGYALTAFDFALLAFTLISPNPLLPADFPPQMTLHSGNFVYFYVLLTGLAFGLDPREVLWGGVVGALSWLVGVAWLVSLPDSVLVPQGEGVDAMVAAMAMPTFVNMDTPVQDVGVFLIVASLLALVVRRSRRLALTQASLERDRANLARYFPPATVDRLARQDAALAQVREQDVAVLFVDLVGFTRWAERHSPREVIELLRDVHARLEEAVFRHHGTLDKFIGDGLMATFGTPDPGPHDATNALACLCAILDEFEDWNEKRKRAGRAPVRISLGLHYGPAVTGNIGTDRRLEFGVLGDTVNVASRLETLTRELGVRAVISNAVVEAVLSETNGDAPDTLRNFVERGPQALRNRAELVPVLTYG
jgi:adenylate cyclase